jgi:hypothetical protein
MLPLPYTGVVEPGRRIVVNHATAALKERMTLMTMNHGRLIAGITPLCALSSPGCAGVTMSSRVMCAAHGGTSNASTKTCSYTTSTRSAREICEQQRGYYDTAADFCQMGQDVK